MLKINCGIEIDPKDNNGIDTHSSGTDSWSTRRPSEVGLFAICPRPSLDGTRTDITLRIPKLRLEAMRRITNRDEATALLLNASLYQCDCYGKQWCPLYKGRGRISYQQHVKREIGV